ncbi:DEAD/DEAH box helicase [uncultured Serinicoccus sp.]|uniref:DEAD/DEAH box helicase n=1 Tax=uncultured Serinicoccus sp. TaxID=735514 RepID=UPI0026195523|nr:DEAD/DEAH box helicase [uncultured Serinicoccus sp.]
MAKPSSAGASGKKPRHSTAQKKAARQAREKQARAQLKGGRGDRRSASRGVEDRGADKQRWRDRDQRDPRGRGERADRRDRPEDRQEGGQDRRRRDWEPRGARPVRREDHRRSWDDDRPRRDRDDRGSSRSTSSGRREDREYHRRPDRDGERRGYQERTWRSHREEREGRPERGHHDGRSWDSGRRREDRGADRREDRGAPQDRWDQGGGRRDDRGGRQGRWDDRGDRGDRGGRQGRREDRGAERHGGRSWGREDQRQTQDPFAEAEAERDAADAAYQERRSAMQAEDVDAAVEADNGFAALGLHEQLVATLARIGITTPFPIQAATIPDAMAGRDLLGRGQTGSGKTMAFGLPLLDRLSRRPRAVPHRPRAVILTPTRELAMQIVDALAPLMRAVDRRFVLVAGGMSYTPQLRALEKGVDVLVATPGRLIDLIDRSAADLSEVEVMVLDEADHMAEMGFVEAIRQILDLTPREGQRLLFSATLDHGVDQVAKTYLKDPVTHSTDDVRASVTTMAHHVFLVHPHHKKPITAAIANRPGRTVVFCRTKLGADRVALQLRESGVFAAALHGGLNQAQRTRVLDAFKSGTLPVLVATDVAARGIHVDDVSLVLQVDPPADHKDYLHRSGRTARAGEDGVVVTLALPHQKRQVSRMLDAAGVETDPQTVAPEDHAVIETAGGSVPVGEPVPQSRLDEVMRPKRPAGRRPGGGGRRQGPAPSGGRRGPQGDRRPRQGGDRRPDRRSRSDDRRSDWRPRD